MKKVRDEKGRIEMNIVQAPLVGGLLLALSLAVGCDSSTPGTQPASMDEMTAYLQQPSEPVASAEEKAPETTEETTQQEPQIVTAHTPKKGKSLREGGGYLSAVGAARFFAEHQMILNQIKHPMNLYRAEHGNFPNSHEEFMSKIIEANLITLPELDPGYEYWYDPSDHELKFRPSETAAEE